MRLSQAIIYLKNVFDFFHRISYGENGSQEFMRDITFYDFHDYRINSILKLICNFAYKVMSPPWPPHKQRSFFPINPK